MPRERGRLDRPREPKGRGAAWTEERGTSDEGRRHLESAPEGSGRIGRAETKMSTKDFLEKDYYKALGVAKTAKPAEIKAAYRKLARKYHPDANKGDASAEERFKEISEAHSVLADPQRRKEYDEARSLFGSGARVPGGSGGQFGFDLGDLFGSSSSGSRLSDLLGGVFGNRTTTQQ